MTADYPPATRPEQLGEYFRQRLDAGDAAGLVALYAEDARLEPPSGDPIEGAAGIRAFYERLIGDGLQVGPGDSLRTLVRGDTALTSTQVGRLQVTVEVAARQSDGSWRWIIDRPSAVSSRSRGSTALAQR